MKNKDMLLMNFQHIKSNLKINSDENYDGWSQIESISVSYPTRDSLKYGTVTIVRKIDETTSKFIKLIANVRQNDRFDLKIVRLIPTKEEFTFDDGIAKKIKESKYITSSTYVFEGTEIKRSEIQLTESGEAKETLFIIYRAFELIYANSNDEYAPKISDKFVSTQIDSPLLATSVGSQKQDELSK